MRIDINDLKDIIVEDNVIAKIEKVEILSEVDKTFRVYFKLLSGNHMFETVTDDICCDENKTYGFKMKNILMAVNAIKSEVTNDVSLEELFLNKYVVLKLDVYEKFSEKTHRSYKRQKVNYMYWNNHLLKDFVEPHEPKNDDDQIDESNLPF